MVPIVREVAWGTSVRWNPKRSLEQESMAVRHGGPAFHRGAGRASALILRLACVVLICCSLTVAQSSEYRAKAGFLAAFPNFVEWPASAFSSEQAPVALCIFGDFSFGTSLAELTRAASIHGRGIEVRWMHKEQELRSCQILFLSRSVAGRYARIFRSLQGASVLTVGETDDFLENGGAIRFLIDEERLQFEVNMSAAEAAHVRISSTMLARAHQIRRPETAKISVANHTDAMN